MLNKTHRYALTRSGSYVVLINQRSENLTNANGVQHPVPTPYPIYPVRSLSLRSGSVRVKFIALYTICAQVFASDLHVVCTF